MMMLPVVTIEIREVIASQFHGEGALHGVLKRENTFQEGGNNNAKNW
jgi:hypothetical protein